MTNLAERLCVPCQGGLPPLTEAEYRGLLAELPTWHVVDGHHLRRVVLFPDFVQALAFVNAVGALAEDAGHHPDLLLGWGKVEVSLWTHKIDGLAEADFVLAARIERLVAG